MSEKSTPILDRTARSMHDRLFEPYNPENPTLTDRVVKFISTVQYPDLDEEHRRQHIDRCKPWFKGSFSVFALLDGHPIIAALPFLFGRRTATPQTPMSTTNVRRFVLFLGAIMGALMGIALLAQLFPAHAQQPTTYRDASGRLISTATDNRDGTTTFRDASGRLQSTATRNGDGTTTYRDASGRLQSTSSRR